MSEDMQNWRPLLSSAASKLSSFKGYLASKDPRPLASPPYRGAGDPSGSGAGPGTRQSWTQWAGDKLRRNNQSQGENANVVEKISLFPGWATRRLHQQSLDEDPHFDVEVFVAGFAARLNSPECMSRSQRAFLRLAKGYASLPKLLNEPQPSQVASPSTEMSEMQNLEEQFRQLSNNSNSSPSDPSATVGTPLQRSPSNSSQSSSSSNVQPIERTFSITSSVQELHSNLERRLMPFWSSALSSRAVRISIYASEDAASIAHALGNEAHDLENPKLRPIASRSVATGQDGSFQIKFGLPWDVLCKHPDGVQVAFGGITMEHDFFVLAELLPPSPSPPASAGLQPVPFNDTPVSRIQIKIPLSHTPLRVISDIDDTVKMANVLSGARVVFYTVFVQNLADIVIPGMGNWYTRMWKQGARFHYVSNGPFEVLPILNEFFPLAGLPPGSVKLRSYAGRSLFNGFLSAPAVRKRQGMMDILNSFPESQFILVGDSGEQDMELYATVAMERPQQILAVFIRDARGFPGGEKPQPVDDPVGAFAHIRWKSYPQRSESNGGVRGFRQMSRGTPNDVTPTTMTSGPTPLYANRQSAPPSRKRQSSTDYFSQPGRSCTTPTSANGSGSASWLASSQVQEEPPSGEFDTSVWLGPKPTKVPDAEWKQMELQMRVDRARMSMPQSVRFRLFVNPEECVESFEVLDQLNRTDPNATIKAGGTPPVSARLPCS